MVLRLPLPSVVPDTGPGGGIVTAMQGINSLTAGNLDNRIKAIQAQYAPITSQAEAASKLAYANLMGPQFISKLFGNENILANIPDAQKDTILKNITQAGTNQSTISPNQFSLSNLTQTQPNSIGDFLLNKIFNHGQQPPSSPNNALTSSQSSLSAEDKKNISNMKPGDSYVVKGNKPILNQPITPPPVVSQPKPTFAENVANYKSILSEGTKAGEIRSKDISDLNNTYFNSRTTQTTLDNLSNIVKSPEFEQIRQVPLAGHNELSYYAKLGTPAQQNMVGQYYTLTGDVIRNSARDFAGQFRKGEQQLLQGMKPNPSDTVDTARGKLEQLSVLNRMLMERARLTSEIMNKNHINKLQAEEIADKQINGDAIRNEIHNTLNPKPTDEDIDYMASKYKISKDEVKKRLTERGIL